MATSEEELNKKIQELKKLQTELNNATTVSEQNRLLLDQNKLLAEANQYYEANEDSLGNQRKALKDNLDELNKTNKSLQSLLLVNKSITSTFKTMSTDTAKFARSTSEWFNKGQKLAEQYLQVSKNIGLSESKSRLVANNFNAAVRESLLLGTSIGELEQMMSNFAD